jgi:hypothetical protein
MADNKYQNGKIYKIVDNTTDKVYIGSTCRSLTSRLQEHESNYRRYLNGNYHYITSFDIIKSDDYRIELIENVNAITKEELYIRERHHIINTPNIVNKLKQLNRTRDERLNQARKTNQQYRIDNKEILKSKREQYWIDNKTKINKKRRVKYMCCICNCCYSYAYKSEHYKTKKHQNYETKHSHIVNHINESFEIVEQLTNALDNTDELRRLSECLSMGFEDIRH